MIVRVGRLHYRENPDTILARANRLLGYLIYSAAFNGLSDQVRNPVLSRLTDILEGRDNLPEFVHLTKDTRQEILLILRDTMPEFKSFPVAPE